MRNYIRFWHVNLNNEPAIACGSDSAFYLDGRWNRATAIRKASEQAAKLNRCLNKGYIGLSFSEAGPMIAL